APLVRTLHPPHRQAVLIEIKLRLLQILLGEATHADALGLDRSGALEHQGVMASLGNAAQVQRVLVLVADDEADQIDIERPALAEVVHVQQRMAGAGDVERRVIVRARDGHRVTPSRTYHLSQSYQALGPLTARFLVSADPAPIAVHRIT